MFIRKIYFYLHGSAANWIITFLFNKYFTNKNKLLNIIRHVTKKSIKGRGLKLLVGGAYSENSL